MSYLTKQCLLLLLSCVTITFSSKSLADPLDSLVPVYTKGDVLPLAPARAGIVYDEIKQSKVIENMPAILSQDDLGDCRASSLTTIMQKHSCDKWKDKIPDCKNPPERFNISSFGMMVYTNKDLIQDETFQPLQKKARSMHEIIKDIAKYPTFILDSCKPFANLVNSFSSNGTNGLKNRDKFFNYLQKMYQSKKANTEADVADCPDCLNEIAKATGINADLFNLRKALSKDNYDKFLYTLFFDGCDFKSFAGGFKPYGFPNEITNATPSDIKNKIIEGLQKNKPVLFPRLCMAVDSNDGCISGHSIVISGYKKVCNGSVCKDVFKVQNSWGESWQKANNDGWVDADILADSTIRRTSQKDTYVTAGAVLWLEP